MAKIRVYSKRIGSDIEIEITELARIGKEAFGHTGWNRWSRWSRGPN